jgi:homogentisate 1,2-dioxygenase
MGEEGFSSDSSLLYHRDVPSALVDAEPWTPGELATAPNAPLKPRHLKLHDLFGDDWKAQDPVTGRRLVLGNADVRISYVVAGETSPLYRNAVGDECVYVESGSATVETVFGALEAKQGDYVILPRATTHRWLPDPAEPLRLYAIEANSHIAPPKRYLSRYGQLLEHAPYCERDLHGPGEPLLVEETDVEVLVKHRASGGGITGTRHVVPTHPLTWSAGTAACTRTRSTWPTSNRSPAGCTSRRRCTRCSRPPTSWSATSCRARWTTTRCRCRCPTTTPMWTPTR